MSMLTTRLQILVSPHQRRRLETEAHARGESVGELVRQAIDARYGAMPTREERIAAVQRLRDAPLGTLPLTPEQISRVHEQKIEEEYPEIFPPRQTP